MTNVGALALVAVGGACGAVARHLVGLASRRALATGPWAGFPLGTVLVNVAGCFLLALLAGLAARGVGNRASALLVGTGFLGGLTTFSAFGVEGASLFAAGRAGPGALYLAANLALGGAAVLGGWALAAALPLPSTGE